MEIKNHNDRQALIIIFLRLNGDTVRSNLKKAKKHSNAHTWWLYTLVYEKTIKGVTNQVETQFVVLSYWTLINFAQRPNLKRFETGNPFCAKLFTYQSMPKLAGYFQTVRS